MIRRHVPAPLAALMGIALLLGITWSVLTPAFQAPDEQSHFAYTQYFAETGKLPGTPDRPIYSTEHAFAAAAAGSDAVTAQRALRPEWSERRHRAWQAAHADDPRGDGGGPQSAAGYPPASYAWEAIGYRLAGGGDFFARLTAARLFSALWLPVTVLGAWLLAGELFGRRRELQVAAAAVPALLPMFAFVSGSVSPDGMMYALWSLVLWLGVRTLRGATPWQLAAFVGLVGAACLTKATSYALLPAAVLVVAVGIRRRRWPAAAAVAGAVVVWFTVALLVGREVGGDIVVTGESARSPSVGGLLSSVWDFYVPHSFDRYEPFDTFIAGSWAAFGWLEVRFPRGLYLLAAAAVVAVLVAAGVVVWRARRRADPWVIAFLALVVVALLAGLHWTAYRLSLSDQPFMQGRYLLPVGALMGAAVAAALTLVPAPRRATALTTGLALLFAVQTASIALMLERFYA